MPRSVKRERVCFDVVEGGGIEPAALDPQTSAVCPRMSQHVQFSLKIRILHLGVFRWTNPNGGQTVVSPIAKLSEEAHYNE